jgi:PncC family amidohydrolase
MKMSLGVGAELIEKHGVISSEVACDMARAALRSLDTNYGIGITGVAGGEPVDGHPPGTMHIAIHDGHEAQPLSYTFYQGRPATKRRAVTTALFLLRRALLARA